MTDLKLEQVLDRLASLQGRVARQEVELARYRRRRRFHLSLPLLVAGLLVALAPVSVLATNPFNDLNPGSVHNANIDAIFNAGITTGCAPNVSFCPNATVTREEMASFLARLGGLGANPPVANAKTAQTATSATNATSAATAGSAQTAGRLATNPVGGVAFAANDLVRVASSGPAAMAPALNANSFTTLAAVRIAVPGPGFVLVTGGTVVEGTGEALVRLRDTADASASNASPALTITVDANAKINSATPSWVFQVAAPGPRSYVIEAQGPDNLIAGGSSVQITALYVPFGSTGGTTP